MNAWELEIRESVRQTLADYTAATDRFDLRALASVLRAGGRPGVHRRCRTADGPGGIEAGLGAAMEPRDPDRKRRRRRTSATTFRASGSARSTEDRVEVSSYFAVHTDVGLDHWGRYRDVLFPSTDRWLFAHRRISVDGFAANSLMAVTQISSR